MNSENEPSSSMIFENLIDKKDLAKKLSVSISFIDKMMASEGLPYMKIGRLVRFRWNDVLSWLERRKLT